MAEITAAAVKELRTRTGAGMMDCKTVLAEAGGDIEKAIDLLREKGLAKAAKKADRSASDGRIYARISDDKHLGVLLELDCETDFVAKTDEFNALAGELCKIASDKKPADAAAMLELPAGEGKVNDMIIAAIAKMGENIVLRRVSIFESDGCMFSYIHTNFKVGVLLELGNDGASQADLDEVGHELCMQIAAANPSYIRREEVTAADLDHEREIYKKQALEEGKPANIVDKIADGKINSFYKDNCLLEQDYIRDPKTKVGSIVKAGITVRKMARFSIGD